MWFQIRRKLFTADKNGDKKKAMENLENFCFLKMFFELVRNFCFNFFLLVSSVNLFEVSEKKVKSQNIF
jgi:hypothetical protein